MELTDIQSGLTKVLVGGTVQSMKVAGPELEIFFSGTGLNVSIDTDAWIFVGNRKDFDPAEIHDEQFFLRREDAIIGLYRLTGYDVEAVTANSSGVLELRIGDKDVLIFPVVTTSPSAQDSWDLMVGERKGRSRYLGFYAGDGFLPGQLDDGASQP